jgi:molybdate transport system ATP-binding protein
MGELSFGLQRVALVLRGLIKEPELLIFDEPCQGLDDENTDAVLNAVSTVVDRGLSTVLFISHDPLQEVRGITHSLELYRHELGGCSARVQSEGAKSGNETV